MNPLASTYTSRVLAVGKNAVPYFAKAIVVVGLIYLVGKIIEQLPTLLIVVLWALLSSGLSIGFAYHKLIKKTYMQVQFKSTSRLAKLIGGRILSLTIGFILAAILVAGLFLEMPKWDAREWVIVLVAIPLYYAVFQIMGKLVNQEFETEYQTSRAALFAGVVTGVLLCIAFAALHYFFPAPAYANIADALELSRHPLVDSSSVLLQESGKALGLIDVVTKYVAHKMQEISPTAFFVAQIIMYASALFGLANMLSICSLNWSELKKVFYPLVPKSRLAEEEESERTNVKTDKTLQERRTKAVPVRRFIATACILPIVLVTGFFLAEAQAESAIHTDGYSKIQELARGALSNVVYCIDGKYYDKDRTDEVINQAQIDATKLSSDAKEELTALINDSYAKREENIQSFLDWYYGFFTDYEMIGQYFAGTVEDFVTDKFTSAIE